MWKRRDGFYKVSAPGHAQRATQLHATQYVHSTKHDSYHMLLISLLLSKHLFFLHPFSASKTELARLKFQGLAIKRQIFIMNKRSLPEEMGAGPLSLALTVRRLLPKATS